MESLPDMDRRNRDGDIEPEDEHRYPCACGNPACIADDREQGNYRIRGEWFAADCELAKFHPDVVGSVLAALHQDEINDDFNRSRR